MSTNSLDPIVSRSYTTGLVNTKDTYQYLLCPDCSTVDLQVSDADVLIGFGQGTVFIGGGVYPVNDEHFIPTTSGLDRKCDIIRYKSANAGVPAQIVISARP